MTSIAFTAEFSTNNGEINNLKQQVNILEQKINSLEEYNNNLLSNIKWIFGLSITLMLFLVGSFSWFSNKITDREIKNIKEKLRLEQKNKFEEIKDNIESNFEEEVRNIKEKNKETIKKKIKYRTSILEEKINVLTVDLLKFKLENSKSKFPIYIYRRIVENASNIFEREYEIGNILKEIEEKLNEDINLEPHEEEDLNYLLKNVPKRFESQKNRIKNIINN